MTDTWEERVYALMVALQPKPFRQQYGEEMKLMLRDMLKDPETPRWQVWMAMLDDVGNLMGGGVKVGALSGLLVLALVFVHGAVAAAGHYAFPEFVLLAVAFVFAASGFIGARRSGFLRGVGAGCLAGAIGALAFPVDAFFSGHRWWGSEMFIGIVLISTMEGVALVVTGAMIGAFGDIQRRIRRSAGAFARAWIAG